MSYTTVFDRIPDEYRDVLNPNVVLSAYELHRPGTRHYHTFNHAIDVMLCQGEYTAIENLRQFGLAALFHDAVYVPGKTNEVMSVIAMTRVLNHHPNACTEGELVWAANAIMLTVDHVNRPMGLDHDTNIFLDADVFVLASEPAKYDSYVSKLMLEYGVVRGGKGWSRWCKGRGEFLTRVLDSRQVFYSYEFSEHEPQARANVLRELHGLRSK